MPRRRLVSLFAAVAAVGIASTACAEQSAAIRVGDDTISERDMLDELDAWAGNEALIPAGQVTGELGDNSYIQAFVGSIVQQRVVFTLYEQLFENEDLKLTDADRDVGRQQLDSDFGPDGRGQFPESYADDLTDTAAMFLKLQQELGTDKLQGDLIDLAEHTDVELSSRFGSWNQDAFMAQLEGEQVTAVIPPVGPQPSRDATDPALDPATGLPAG